MKNKYGIKCPIDWNEIDLRFNWLAINPEGGLFAYENRPILYVNLYWLSIVTECAFVKMVEPPHSSAKCIWQRPKLEK